MNHLRNALLTLAVILSVAFAARADRSGMAREVYGRLLAPCCWIQTLDIHDSELATQLRGEIAERLSRGEPALQIEDDMAARFGERVRAVPRAHDPRVSMALLWMGVMALALLALFVLAFRWTRRRGAALTLRGEEAALAQEPLGEYDARLDRELSRSRSV